MEPKVVDKPWGHERILELNDQYCVKILRLNAAQRTSLQHHEKKTESMWVVKGWGRLEIGDTTIALRPGDFHHIPPGTVHRLMAFRRGPLVILETSTPELDDVVRHEDDYWR